MATYSSKRDEFVGEPRNNLTDFRFQQILSSDPVTKTIAVVGNFNSAGPSALLVLEPCVFEIDDVRLLTHKAHLDSCVINEPYSSFIAHTDGKFSVSLTYPATQKHIEKWEEHDHVRVIETAEIFEKIVSPYIDNLPESRIQWVYNILDGIKESDRIIFEDPDPKTGFVLLPDIKWDGVSRSTMYLQAIVHDRTIRCIRDLRACHLPLLENMLECALKAVSQRYIVPQPLLRTFIHYHPSFYHLHIHIAHSAIATGTSVAGKAFLLEDVIENLRMDGNYYKNRSFCCYLPENHDIYKLITEFKPE